MKALQAFRRALVQMDNLLVYSYYSDSKREILISKMKQLTNQEHLVYRLPNSHLVTSLPFIDQELDTQVPKSKVAYLIAAQQQQMNKNTEDYVEEMPLPVLAYVDSEQFEQQVARVKAKLEQREPSKKKQGTFPELPKKIAVKDLPVVTESVSKGIARYERATSQNINLELCKKYGPLVLKELAEILERERVNLQAGIDREREAIETLNKDRKYEELETYQREYDIGERIKIMLNKRRKVD